MNISKDEITAGELVEEIQSLAPERKVWAFIRDMDETEQARKTAAQRVRDFRNKMKDEDPGEIERTIDEAVQAVRSATA